MNLWRLAWSSLMVFNSGDSVWILGGGTKLLRCRGDKSDSGRKGGWDHKLWPCLLSLNCRLNSLGKDPVILAVTIKQVGFCRPASFSVQDKPQQSCAADHLSPVRQPSPSAVEELATQLDGHQEIILSLLWAVWASCLYHYMPYFPCSKLTTCWVLLRHLYSFRAVKFFQGVREHPRKMTSGERFPTCLS